MDSADGFDAVRGALYLVRLPILLASDGGVSTSGLAGMESMSGGRKLPLACGEDEQRSKCSVITAVPSRCGNHRAQNVGSLTAESDIR